MSNDCLSEIRDLIFSETQNNELSHKITFKIGQYFKGETVYFKKSELLKQRNQEIRNKYNGTNSRQLCREYGITVRHLANILRDMPSKYQLSLEGG